ncbi:ATP-binding protein [Vibrio sp.]|nr:ATP-binding protein [Vibrio sp.]
MLSKNKPAGKKVESIKYKLTRSIVSLSCSLILISLVFSYFSARHEIDEVYDARLGQAAKLLMMVVSHDATSIQDLGSQADFQTWITKLNDPEMYGDDEEESNHGHPYEKKFAYQYYKNNQLVWSSNQSLTSLDITQTESGFSTILQNGIDWRAFLFPTSDDDFILVAEQLEVRREAIKEIGFSTAVPQFILIPFLVWALILAVNRSFTPLTNLNDALSVRNEANLDPIQLEEKSTELDPLVNTLNSLLHQLDEAWEREKRFTKMAAHELKTPLTILKLNAENALKTQDNEQRNQDLSNIVSGIDRTDRMLSQLLVLAKIETLRDIECKDIELESLLQETIAHLVPMALKQNQSIELRAKPIALKGDSTLLGILFKNLIDNAIRYSGVGADIVVEVAELNHGLVINVHDSGQDISEEIRERLFEHFYRGHSDKGNGTGLGMSITRHIATLHKAHIQLLPRSHNQNTFSVTFDNIRS